MRIAEGVELLRIYYVRGASKVKFGSSLRYAVGDPPTAGWQHAIVVRGDRNSTILDPFTFESYGVPNTCAELETCEEPKMPDEVQARSWLCQHLPATWAELQNLGFQRDYDTVALLLRRLDQPVPKQMLRDGEEDSRRKGGKQVESQLTKPVKLKGKRGRFLAWFLEAEDGARSVREAMAEFGMSRSNALSYLYMLQKDHGIGYELVGDVATVSLPEGCDDPFDPPGEWDPQPERVVPKEEVTGIDEPSPQPPAETDDDDDSWLD